MLTKKVTGSGLCKHNFMVFAEAESKVCFKRGLSDGKCHISKLNYSIEKKFAVSKNLISVKEKYFFISLIAFRADFAFLKVLSTC